MEFWSATLFLLVLNVYSGYFGPCNALATNLRDFKLISGGDDVQIASVIIQIVWWLTTQTKSTVKPIHKYSIFPLKQEKTHRNFMKTELFSLMSWYLNLHFVNTSQIFFHIFVTLNFQKKHKIIKINIKLIWQISQITLRVNVNSNFRWMLTILTCSSDFERRVNRLTWWFWWDIQSIQKNSSLKTTTKKLSFLFFLDRTAK